MLKSLVPQRAVAWNLLRLKSTALLKPHPMVCTGNLWWKITQMILKVFTDNFTGTFKLLNNTFYSFFERGRRFWGRERR